MFKYEFKRAINTPGFKFGIILATFVAMADYFINVLPLIISNHRLLEEGNSLYEVIPLNSYEKWIGGGIPVLQSLFFSLYHYLQQYHMEIRILRI